MTYPYQGHQYPYDSRWPPRPPQQQYNAPIYPQQVYSYPQYPHPHHQHSVPFPTNQNPTPATPRQYAHHYFATPPRYPAQQPRVDRGRDYLSSLTTSVSNLNLDHQAGPSRLSTVDKPLPRLPPPPIPARPTSLPSYSSQIPPLPTPPSVQAHSEPPAHAAPISTPTRKSFTPSFHPHNSPSQGDLLRPPDVHRPYSAPQIPSSKSKKGKGKEEILDLTLDSSDDEDEFWESPSRVGASKSKKASPRHRRAISELPRTPIKTKSKSPTKPKPQAPPSPASPNAVRCSGYTRAGQPCKRVVKSTAPFLLTRDTNLSDGTKEERYCKDHAGMICQVGGFYWRGTGQNVWIDFSDYIPAGLGQQTQTLLRTTMESRLTDKELPGFLYAYELRDKRTPTVSYFKVGRTDNVPRRISEWTSQCQSHTPTLRDIFPRRPPKPNPLSRIGKVAESDTDLHRRGTGSFLPGAFHSGSNNDATRPRVAAMKRWERLVHLELADRSSRDCPLEWGTVRDRCSDCGSVHKEIFPVKRQGSQGSEYDVVVEVVGRWAGFVNAICRDM